LLFSCAALLLIKAASNWNISVPDFKRYVQYWVETGSQVE
jgi:hypothetical protein